jgi:KaiC/GvpD/RAD55 family RecA-like ATPase
VSAFAPVHSVHFYDTNEALIERLCGIASSSLNIGNTVLIVATQDHRKQLVDALEQKGVAVETHIREERFVLCDAKEMVSRFMVGPMPDTGLFRSSMGKLLADAKKSARSKEQALVVFGEMVGVLWDEGNKAGALAVERLWNDILNETAFHLRINDCHRVRLGIPVNEN